MIRSIFLYLDRTYVLQKNNLKSIWDFGLELFRDFILSDSDIQSKLVKDLLREIDLDRSAFLFVFDFIEMGNKSQKNL